MAKDLDQDEGTEQEQRSQREISPLSGAWIAIGAGIGVALGVAFGNIAVGIAIGAAIGVGAMIAQNAGSRKK